jgi:flavin-dependent dehydrogenase
MRAQVAIIGAGPTGCTIATWLARAGRDVLLLERTEIPRIAVGESLIPACVPVLLELGVDMTGFQPKHGAVFTRAGQSVRFAFAEALRTDWPMAWQTPRSDLDLRVRKVALEAGARMVYTQVNDVRFEQGRPTLFTDAGPIEADLVIDAGGRDQLLARKLGVRERHPWLKNSAMTAWHTGVRPQELEQPGDIAVCGFPGGWFWFIPFLDGTWSVGAVTTPDGPKGPGRFQEAVERCPEAQARLEGAVRIEEFRGASDISVRSSKLHGPGWILAGDAATFIDPIFSTGLSLGLNGGRRLAKLLLDETHVPLTERLDAWEAWCRASAAAFEPMVEAYYNGTFLDVALADRARQQDTVRKAIVSLLAGDVFDEQFDAPRRFGQRFPSIHRMVTSPTAG